MATQAKTLDATDRQLLAILQRDCDLSLAVLAAMVKLTTTPCWKRLQRLQVAGVITRRVVLLDPKAINLGVTGPSKPELHLRNSAQLANDRRRGP